MKRGWFIILLTVVLIFTQFPTSVIKANDSEINLYLDGQALQLNEPARLMSGHTMVPLRALAEAMGARVDWEASEKKITVTKADTTLIMNINKITAYINNQTVKLVSPPLLSNGVTLVPARWLVESLGAEVTWNAQTKTASVHTKKNELPIVGSSQHLKALLAESQQHQNLNFTENAMPVESTSAPMVSEDSSSRSLASGSAYSSTNIQVQGVDEADIVKTDGKYIYQVTQGQIIISKVYPVSDLKVVNTLQYPEQNFYPSEIYVDSNYLIVIGNKHYPYYHNELMTLLYPVDTTVIVIIYDITDKSNLTLLREVEMEGNYVSSRKIGTNLYLVANKYIHYYGNQLEDDEIPAPSYRDSASDDVLKPMSYDNIRYFPGPIQPMYLMVAGIQLDRPEVEVDVSSYLGSSHNIYASQEHLYTVVTEYDYSRSTPTDSNTSELLRIMPVASEAKTKIYKFALNQGSIHYLGQGEVPGSILNQFSMDEHEGYFRIATNQGNMWGTEENISRNNVYVLDSSLNISGKIENIAPGERIYSVRFMGDRGYMVTFRNVDPLFVIDLKNPTAPKILGELKIPGYSDYLHPYDENHLIGFGMNTIEVEQQDSQGNPLEPIALIQGMKMAIFDVSDVTNPKEKFTEFIGDRGTYSELLYNHKPLLFSKEKNLLSFPVTVMKIDPNQQNQDPFMNYGQFEFQGAYVYHIDMNTGFTLRGGITHLNEQEINQAAKFWFDYEKTVQRIVYIDDTLYTISDRMIKANRLSDLTEINNLQIK